MTDSDSVSVLFPASVFMSVPDSDTASVSVSVPISISVLVSV